MTELRGEGSDWDQTYHDVGYEWCRPCREWHRPPECDIDEDGRSLDPSSGRSWDEEVDEMSGKPICGVCGQEITDEAAFFDPPTFTMQPVPGRPGVVRPVSNKPTRVDPETGGVCWCSQEGADERT